MRNVSINPSKKSWLIPLIIFLMTISLMGCSGPEKVLLPFTPTGTVTLTATPDLRTAQKFVFASVTKYLTARMGDKAILTITFEPAFLLSDKFSIVEWKDHNVREMEICQQPCGFTGEWKPFAPTYRCTVLVEHIGRRFMTCQLRARFRTTDGAILYATHTSSIANDGILEVGTWGIGEYNPQTPISGYSENEQPDAAATATYVAFAQNHVAGSIEINHNENDKMSAKKGSTIELELSLQATSPFADITEMRLLEDGAWYFYDPSSSTPVHCVSEDEMNRAAWELFVPTRTYSIDVNFENWVDYGYAVQYRDRLGNISPLYCNLISVEGMPVQ